MTLPFKIDGSSHREGKALIRNIITPLPYSIHVHENISVILGVRHLSEELIKSAVKDTPLDSITILKLNFSELSGKKIKVRCSGMSIPVSLGNFATGNELHVFQSVCHIMVQQSK